MWGFFGVAISYFVVDLSSSEGLVSVWVVVGGGFMGCLVYLTTALLPCLYFPANVSDLKSVVDFIAWFIRLDCLVSWLRWFR